MTAIVENDGKRTLWNSCIELLQYTVEMMTQVVTFTLQRKLCKSLLKHELFPGFTWLQCSNFLGSAIHSDGTSNIASTRMDSYC